MITAPSLELSVAGSARVLRLVWRRDRERGRERERERQKAIEQHFSRTTGGRVAKVLRWVY